MAVLDLRGTHGSGKSWIVHQLLTRYRSEPIVEGSMHLGYVLPQLDAAVVGRYSTTCGGCDGVGSADEVVRRARLFAKRYRHVVLEGILVAHTFARYARLASELQVYGYVFCFLDTPLATCLARVRARRLRRGDLRPLNPRNVIHDHCNIWEGVRAKCVAAGLHVLVLPWRNPLEPVLKELT